MDKLTTGSGDDVVAISGSGQSISTGAGDDELRVTDLLGGNFWEAGTGSDRLVADLSGMSSAIMLSSHSAGWNPIFGYNYPSGGSLYSGTPTFNGYQTVYPTQLDFQNIESFNVTGGSGADWLQGIDGDDVFRGNGGGDYLEGGGGNDLLYGGTGDDSLTADGRRLAGRRRWL